MDLRGALFGSTLRVAVTAVVGIVALGGAAFALGVIGVPGVVGVENAFGPVNETTTVIETELGVSNPNPVGVAFGGVGVDYRVTMNSVRVATGDKRGLALESGNSTLNFTTLLRNERIPDWWVTHIENDERTALAVNATVHSGLLDRSATFVPAQRNISTDIVGQLNTTETREVNADAPLVSDPVAYINRTNATWGEVSDAETPIEAEFVVYNPKSYPITVNELGYDITMNGVQMGEGRTNRSYTIPPKSTETVEATLFIRNENLDEWWVSHLERNQRTNLRIDFTLYLDAGGTALEIPVRGLTEERLIETDFFGNKAEGTASGGADNGTADNRTTTTTEDETTATTTTETTTTDETATETTTAENETTTTTEDDGLLGVASVTRRPPLRSVR